MALIMNTTEIASALVYFEATHPELCRRIKLPEKTYEGKVCHALHIGKGRSGSKPAILIIGGVHAREWGGPDILVNFASDLLRAYTCRKGLRYLKKTFRAADIRDIVEQRSLIVFPCVNPDGVEFSHNTRHLWRKNRSKAHLKSNLKKIDVHSPRIGVDINRNYDFLWDFKKHFDPAAWRDGSLASDKSAEETYHGPQAFSEPETRNVRWLMDRFKPASFLDLHSYDGDVLYSWGDAVDQTSNPGQNFTNPRYDGQRGRIGGAYREYISLGDYQVASGMAQAVSDAMRDVRNRPYTAKQAVGLYPTCGTSDDYAASRHIVNPRIRKTFGFTVEFNFEGDTRDPFLATVDPKTLDRTMRDVIPGLIAFCMVASQAQAARKP